MPSARRKSLQKQSSQNTAPKSPSLSERLSSTSYKSNCDQLKLSSNGSRRVEFIKLAQKKLPRFSAKEMAQGFQDKHILIGQVEEYNRRIQLPTFHIKGSFTSDDDVEYEGALRFFLAHAENNITKAVKLTSSTTWRALKPVLFDKFNLTEGVSSGKLVPILYAVRDDGESSVRDEDRPLVLALQACAHVQFVLKVYEEGNDPGSPTELKGKMNHSTSFFSAMKKKLNKTKSKEQVIPSTNTRTLPKQGKEPISPMTSKAKHSRQKSDSSSTGSRKKTDNTLQKTASSNLAESVAAQARSMENLSKAGKTVRKKQKPHHRFDNTGTNMLAIDDTEEFITIHGERDDLGVDEVVIPIDGGMTVRDIISDVLDECEISLANIDDYILCDVIGREIEGLWLTDYAREMNDSEKPLLLISMMKPSEGLLRRFEIRNLHKDDEASSHDTTNLGDLLHFQRRDIERNTSNSLSSLSNTTDYNSQTLKFPTDTPYFLTIQSYDTQQDTVLHLITRTTSIIGSSSDEDECNMRLFAPDILLQHCWVCKVYDNENEKDYKCVSIAPFPGARVCINDAEINKKTNIKPGDMIALGNSYVFLFKDPKQAKLSSNDTKQAAKQNILDHENPSSLYEKERRWHDVLNAVDTLLFSSDKQNELLVKIFNIVNPLDEGYKLTPAHLLALALDHARQIMSSEEFGYFLSKACTDLQNVVWESAKTLQMNAQETESANPMGSFQRIVPHIQSVFFWTSNCVELRAHLSSSMSSLGSIITNQEIMDEALFVLADAITYAFQQTVYHLTKVLYPTLDLILSDNPFVKHADKSVSMNETLQALSAILSLCKQSNLNMEITQQLIAYLFFFLGTSLCNKLFEQDSVTVFYNWEEGVKIRKNLELLECWAIESSLEAVNVYLSKAISIADFLATSKQFLLQASWSQLRNLYPSISTSQLRHLLDNYDIGNRAIPAHWSTPSEDICSVMEEGILVSFEDHPPLVMPSVSSLNLRKKVNDKTFNQHLDSLNSQFGHLHSEDETDSGFDLGHSQSPTEPEDHGKTFGEHTKAGSRSSNNSETGSKSYTPIFKKKKDTLPIRKPVELKPIAHSITNSESSDEDDEHDEHDIDYIHPSRRVLVNGMNGL